MNPILFFLFLSVDGHRMTMMCSMYGPPGRGSKSRDGAGAGG